MDAQQQLYGLMAVAEDQQKAVKAAIDGLTAERAALAKERAALAQAAASVARAGRDIQCAVDGAVPALQEAAGGAVGHAVRVALAGGAEVAARAFDGATRPIVGQLAGFVHAAGEAEGKISGAVEAFGWRWAMVAFGAAAGGIVAVLLAAWLAVWWQRDEVEQLTAQKAALLGEVTQLQATAEGWAKRGGRAKLVTCGDKDRLCVRVDKGSVYGEDGDYYVLRGY